MDFFVLLLHTELPCAALPQWTSLYCSPTMDFLLIRPHKGIAIFGGMNHTAIFCRKTHNAILCRKNRTVIFCIKNHHESRVSSAARGTVRVISHFSSQAPALHCTETELPPREILPNLLILSKSRVAPADWKDTRGTISFRMLRTLTVLYCTVLYCT